MLLAAAIALAAKLVRSRRKASRGLSRQELVCRKMKAMEPRFIARKQSKEWAGAEPSAEFRQSIDNLRGIEYKVQKCNLWDSCKLHIR